MTLLLPHRRGGQAPWLKNPLWIKARAVPTFHIDANFSQTPVDRVSGSSLLGISRASTGTYLDDNEDLQTAASHSPRREWNATYRTWEWLLEPASTNGITNNSGTGLVAGTPGTLPTGWSVTGFTSLTRQVVGTGTFKGVTYVDIRYWGTSGGTNGKIYLANTAVIAAAQGQVWHLSGWLQVVGGSLANVSAIELACQEYNSSAVLLGNSTLGSSSATTNTSWQRIFRRATIAASTASSIRPHVDITFTSSAAIDFTLRIGLVQAEQSLAPTSAIPTTNAAVTRSADIWTCSGTLFTRWFNGGQGTVFIRAREYPYYGTTADRYFYDFVQNAAPTSNFIRQWIWTGNSTAITSSVYSGGAISAEVAQAPVGNAPRASALAYGPNSFSFSMNRIPPEYDSSGNLPSSIDLLRLGGPSTLAGGITEFAFFPEALPLDRLVDMVN